MHLRLLSVTDFRSWPQADVTLAPGVTAFVGPNGQGKTNLVEAVGYLATLSSHRAAIDAPLVRSGATSAVIRGIVVRDGRELRIEIEIAPGRTNRVRLNGSPLPRPREVLGLLRTVVFAPEDLAIVKGDPSERRRFIDDLLVAQTPRYAAVRSDYDRVLRQRNALLKSAASAGVRASSGSAQLQTLDVWDVHLAEAGASLLAGRHALLDALGPLVAKAYSEVSGGGVDVSIGYDGGLAPELATATDRDQLAAALAQQLLDMRGKELERGVTLVGPHRDDISLMLGELPARGFASHGESWSFALALRLAAYEALRADGDDPVLILDDVFAELDARRRDALASLVEDAEQVLITAAATADVPEQLSGARIDVLNGEVRYG